MTDDIQVKIHSVITEGLQMLYSQHYTYQGLTGSVLSHRDFADYFPRRFYEQFKKYFSCATDEGTYLEVLHVYDHANKRWADEMPGQTPKENLLFASIMLYQVMAEQSILDVAPNASNDFHKAFGWAMISSGPGGGPYLHPLKMLEYAGLSPMKCEAPLLQELLFKWTTSPDDCWYKMLESEGIPLMNEIKQS